MAGSTVGWRRSIRFCASFCLALSGALEARADVWRGTAPFCEGECLRGEIRKGVSDFGDGGYCVTGHKVLCGASSPACQAGATKISCYGAVMICGNGYERSVAGDWHSCGTYACGVCVGSGAGGHLSFAPDTCRPGFVFREATKDDHVCVTPAVRETAARDNAEAEARRAPGIGEAVRDACKPGFVWREAIPGDHVCVTPETRAAAAADNGAASARRAAPTQAYGPDACKPGFVWREAIADDHVCVLPASRVRAAADNASAGERRSPIGGSSGPDTCKPGFVWREAAPQDHVCVTTDARGAAAADNGAAASRRADR